MRFSVPVPDASARRTGSGTQLEERDFRFHLSTLEHGGEIRAALSASVPVVYPVLAEACIYRSDGVSGLLKHNRRADYCSCFVGHCQEPRVGRLGRSIGCDCVAI